MFKYNKDGVSILTVQDTRKEKKSGLFPVKIQVIYKRVQRYYSTGKELSPEEWAALLDTKSKRLISIRSEIKNSFEKVETVVKMLVEEDNFSYDALNLRLGKGVGDTVNILFKAKLEALMEDGSVGNALANRSAYKHLENYAGTNILFETVSADWLKKYDKEMIEEGKSYTTVSIYLRCLRAIFNDAKTAGIIKENQYPFGKGKYEIPIGKGRKMALNLQQIKQIITFSDGTEATEHYRDLWFFLYLCNGINVNDMLKLKFSNIDNDEVHFYRSKTLHTSREKKEIEALLTPEMKQIIERWGNADKSPDNYVFPFLDGYNTPM
jgi:hypothetical protein